MSERDVRAREGSAVSTMRYSSSSRIAEFIVTDMGGGRWLSGLAAREVDLGTGREPFWEEDRRGREDVDAADSVRFRTGGWGVRPTEAVTVSEGGRLLVLPKLATDPLHEDELEDVDMREDRRERAATVMWKRSCSERGDGPGMGGRGSEGGREGGGFGVVETLWGIKVGGTGNSLRRTLRVCFRDIMVGEKERNGGRGRESQALSRGGVCACARPQVRAEKAKKRRNLKVSD
jgi:hypothetical protein